MSAAPLADVRRLSSPPTPAEIAALRVGDVVTLTGEVVLCAGMTTHQRIRDTMARGEPLPIDLRGAALLHVGSYSDETPDGRLRIRYINPTTSTRFNDFMPDIVRGQALRLVGGKGGLDERSVRALQDAGAVYLSFLGGGCTLLSRAIRDVLAVEWADLIPHYRLVRLRVEDLGPATVGIDAHGGSLYRDLADAARARLPDIVAELALARRSASDDPLA